MRRFLFAALALIFVGQSSGISVAKPSARSANQQSVLAEIQVDLAQLLASAEATHIGALVTGSADRWAAIHAPPPPRLTAPSVDPHKAFLREKIRPTITGEGVRGNPPSMVIKPLLLKDAEKLHPPSATATSAPAASMLSRSSVPFLLKSVALPAPAVKQHVIHRPIRSMDVSTGSANGTGINPWWTYDEGTLPGTGKYMVNVGTGNLVVQSDDVDVTERGIDLAFRRTYNSQSGRNWNGSAQSDDGAPTPGMYGARWTNTFDTHLATNSSGGVSVFDIDGARYDYTPNGTGCLTAPSGMYNTLCWDGGCGYFWGKKNGTVYHYWEPSFGSGCEWWASAGQAYAGRLFMILGRNQNNWVQLTYYWAGGDSTSSANLTQITVTHADTQTLTLNFGVVSVGGIGNIRLLSSVTRPDGAQVTYAYDTGENLVAVNKIGNNSASTLTEDYGYGAGELAWTSNPRWNLSGGSDGSFTNFYYDGSGRATGALLYGLRNFTPTDGTSTPLQPISTGLNTIAYTTYSYSSGLTQLSDVDGHAINWYYDGPGRVTQTQEWTGSLWLITSASWDSSNNLTETVDARGNPTDYAYDSNGNTVAVALPTVSTNQGTFRPTSLYSFDRTNNANNIVASCDPVRTHALGQDWTSNPGASDSLCPNSSGATRDTWDYGDGAQPFGRLSTSYTPLGYHRAYSYITNPGDYGLPSDVTGDSMTQADNTVRSPHQSFAYDGYGNLTSYSSGVGSSTLSYDGNNRLTAITDPDGVTTRKCYFANGQPQAQQTAYQYALDGGVTCGSNSESYAYDADGDVVNEIHHFASQAGTTVKFYDGSDRLVEVQQPRDSGHDLYSYAWMTRYFYDLSQNNTVSVDGASFHAYGNLFKTQEYLPGNPVIQPNTTPASPVWMDVRGTSFDALDRPLAAYENAFGTTPKSTNSYDGNSNYGFLSQSQTATGQQTIPSYLAAGWLSGKAYLNDGGITPSETYTYDADGRATAINSSTFGAEGLTYDSDGRLSADVEPSGGGYSSPATLAYDYYADGLRKDISISSSVVSASNAFQYSYRTDGLLQTEHLNYPITGDFAWTYTNAGRDLTQSDPYTGVAIPLSGGPSTRTLQAKTFIYDSYGRVSSLVLPQGYTFGTITYDTEDETTGYTRSNAYCGSRLICHNATRTQIYTVRGELAAIGDSDTSMNLTQASANGTMVSSGDGFDTRSGMIINKNLTRYAIGTPYAYDAAGRQTQVTDLYPYGTYPAYATRAYDAENHIVSQSYTSPSFTCPRDGSLAMCGNTPPDSTGDQTLPTTTNTYGWGPNGHPILLGQAGGAASVHWDGDDVLFENTSIGLVDVQIGKLATGIGSNFTISDRDMTGEQVSSHASMAFGAWSGGPPSRQCGACSKGEGNHTIPGSVDSTYDSVQGSSYSPATTYLSGVREDGYNDGFGNTFQGVRAYDGNLGQWTSPDAYAGEVHDPMSQKPFMWNRNNPLEYQDPSGYISIGDVGRAVFNFVIGDDINTLKTSNTSTGAKALAVVSIASNFFPVGRGIEVGGKLLIITVHFAEKAGAQKVTRDMVKATITQGVRYSDSKWPQTMVHTLEGAAPGGKNLTVITNKEGTKLLNAIVHRKPTHASPTRLTKVSGT